MWLQHTWFGSANQARTHLIWIRCVLAWLEWKPAATWPFTGSVWHHWSRRFGFRLYAFLYWLCYLSQFHNPNSAIYSKTVIAYNMVCPPNTTTTHTHTHTHTQYLQEGKCSSIRDVHDDIAQLQLHLSWLPDLKFTQKSFWALRQRRKAILHCSLLKRGTHTLPGHKKQMLAKLCIKTMWFPKGPKKHKLRNPYLPRSCNDDLLWHILWTTTLLDFQSAWG